MTTRPELTGPIKRILVINVARIGDTILAVPVLRALREAYPQAEIVCLAHPKRVEILQGLPQIDRSRGITKRSAAFMGWFGESYDLALIFGHELSLLKYALRTARQVIALPSGNAAVDRKLFAVVTDEGVVHAVEDRLRWLKPLGLRPSVRCLDYVPSAAEQSWAIAERKRLVPTAEPLVGFQIASFPTKAYRNWPGESFAELARRLLLVHPQAQILIFGDATDAAASEALAATCHGRARSLAGKLALRQSVAMMQQLDLYIGVDTGPTHLAGALGLPMVALYHCLHPGCYLAPLDHPRFLGVVEHPAAGSDCTPTRAMAEISVDTVWKQVKAALQGLPEAER